MIWVCQNLRECNRNGTWEQFYDANGTPYDCTIDKKLYVGENGTYISHGTMNVVGTVEMVE